MGRASKYRVNKVAVAPPPEVTPVASRAPTLASAPSVGPVSSPQVLRNVDGALLNCGSDPFGKSSAGALSRPAPGAATGPPTDRPWVLIRSADERRRPELTALAEHAGFGSTFHRTAQGALDELAAIQHPRSGRSLPLACLVDAYDEDGDGVIDQGEMSWPLLRMIQRPHAPFEASLKRIFVIVYSRPVAASPRYTLDALGAGARMVTGVAADATRRAGKESEIPNFKGSDLGRFPLVSADFWTSDHLSERSRSVDAFSGTRARGTLTLKRR